MDIAFLPILLSVVSLVAAAFVYHSLNASSSLLKKRLKQVL